VVKIERADAGAATASSKLPTLLRHSTDDFLDQVSSPESAGRARARHAG
jgi:hypothetical protein